MWAQGGGEGPADFWVTCLRTRVRLEMTSWRLPALPDLEPALLGGEGRGLCCLMKASGFPKSLCTVYTASQGPFLWGVCGQPQAAELSSWVKVC